MDASDNSAGASEDQEAGDQETGNQATGLESLGELLAQDETQQNTSGEDDGAASSGSDESTQLTKFNDLAGKTGLDLDALYKLQLTTSEGAEPVTIEALKDAYAESADLDLKTIEFEERQAAEESSMMRAKAELQEILQALPANAVKPEVLEKIRAKAEASNKLERQKTLEVIPGWQDPEVRKTEIAAMAEHLQGYGFPVNYLKNVVSHQHLKYIRDNWQREERIRKALAKVSAGKPGKSTTSKAQKKAPSKGADLSKVKRGSHSNRLEAVFSDID